MKITVTPFLWFSKDAQKAAKFYVSVFGRSPRTKIIESDGMSTVFKIHGTEMIAFNGGPYFQFNEAVSMFVSVKTQKQVDTFWKKLTAGGGKPGQCGWLKDKYGVSWQIVPEALGELLSDSDRTKAERVHDAMMKMKKLDIAALKKAHRGK